MEIRNINTFLQVAKMQSFSKAAEKLGYSQSNVSLQIQQLEKEFNIKLFERTGKNIRLTKNGQVFLFHSSEIIRMVNQAKESLKIDEQKEFISITVGSVECIAASILPDLLVSFHKQYPHIHVSVVVDSKDHLVEKIRNNEIDLFFHVGNKELIRNLTQTVLKKEKMVFVTNNHNLVRQGKIQLSSLIKEPFVLTDKGESYRYELDRILYENDLLILPIIEINNPEIIVHLVEKQIGSSFLPEFCVRHLINKQSIYYIDVDIKPIYMYNQMYYHKNKWINPPLKKFIDFTKEYSLLT